ncbi:uncharacterized protein LOC143218995 [Lasioglossum baleicum]|uniref:uncharacterized protein LOC143218995 n=1 Tax=Lasioglossum baleicum TaxID=434251 RepID=UPI003FCD758A
MGAIIELLLLSVLCASVGTVQGACRHVQNDDMLEYSCVGGQLSDLDSLPASTGKIRISNMPVPVITRDMLARFGSDLWVFGCSYCGIRDIEPGAFQHLDNLQQLSLNNNQLTTIRESSIGGLQYLTFLDLNYNAINTIDDGVFQTLPGLVDLRLSGNRLECLNLEAMSKLKELKRMFLTENSEFKCPNAVSAYLETRGVNFEKDPEWDRITEDQVAVELPDDYETDYYDSTTMPNTPLPPHRERLHPTSPSSPPRQESTTLYAPYSVSFGERINNPTYHPPGWGTSQQETSPMPDVYDKDREKMRPYVPPATIAPLETMTDSPNQQSVDETTLRASWPRLPEPSVTRPEFPLYPPHGNEDSYYGQQSTYSSEANPVPLAPVQQTPSFVESDAGRATESNVIMSPQRPWDDPRIWETAPPEYRKTPPPIPSTEKVTMLVGPLPSQTPILVQPASPDNVYQPPYYEHPVTVHAPPPVSDPIAAQPGQTTTDKPLPDCNSSSTIQRSLGLVIFAVLMVLSGHGFVEGF